MRHPFFLSLLVCFTACPIAVFSQTYASEGCPTELDGDGVVGMSDLLIVLADFGSYCDGAPPPSGPLPVLHFSELHYNPASVQGSDNAFEFLELYNPDSVAVDLEGWSLSEGLSFTFPSGATISAGGYVVVTSSAVTYAGLGYPVYDWGTGGLHNSGELLAIRAPNGQVVESVTYSDAGDWDGAPDGLGPSLERLFLTGDPSSPEQWSASINVGGTPGATNSLWLD
ncbi:MAG: lamin tail domain-containing protein [Flavobacteriales bacterium]|nr:lamin tail domain-containing protein [Flavobacteriales bacterium]